MDTNVVDYSLLGQINEFVIVQNSLKYQKKILVLAGMPFMVHDTIDDSHNASFRFRA